ncbi:hypothetical protein Q3G72_024747 [Acer saccharum]|nr:hypothetical protein Q3G72_024747 [Acer saccharum]
METATIANNIEEKYSFEILDSVHSAAADGDINKLQEHAKRLDQILTPNGNTILHIHITARRPRSRISNNFVRVKSLLDECKKTYQNHHDQELGIKSTKLMLQMTNEAKDTALHEAVRYNHLDVVQLLTKEDPSLPYDANTAGETPLYLAAERGYVKVLKEILGTCDSPVDHGHYDRTALHVVIIRNDIAEKLVLDDPDKQTWTPLSVVFKPHHNSLTGNYDINVLIVALEGRRKAVVWQDRRNEAVSIDLDGGDSSTLMGIVINVPVTRSAGIWKGRHWITLQQIVGVWYNLDSDFKSP